MNPAKQVSLVLAVCLSMVVESHAQQDSQTSWNQFLGPNRDGVIDPSDPIAEFFLETEPTEKWRVPGGEGLSGFAAAGDRAITMANRSGYQVALAVDLASGSFVWETKLAPVYQNQMGGAGPRATPTVDGNLVYAYSGEGVLSALKTVGGKLIWRKDLPRQMRTQPAEYGMASSPLIVDDKVIVHVGGDQGAVVALDKMTGKGIWKSGAGPAGYSSPMLLNVAGKKQVVSLLGDKVIGIDPYTGKLLWSYEFITDYSCNTANPIAIEGDVLISAGENHGSVRLKVSESSGTYNVTEVWASLGPKSCMRSEWQTPLLIGDYLYGFDNVGSAGSVTHLVCVDARNGKQVWREPRFGKGNMVAVGDKVLMSNFKGQLILGTVSPSGYTETSRAGIVGQNRQAPMLVGSSVLLRDKKDLVCLDLKE